MGFLISCPGCKHMLTLPESYIGQKVQCPKCALEFPAYPSSAASMEVDSSAPPAPPEARPKVDPPTSPGEAAPPVSPTAYAPRDRMHGPASAPSLFCVLCGTRVPPADDVCPNCGCPIQTPRDEDDRPRRRRRRREMLPVRSHFAILATILFPVGAALMIGVPIAADIFRRNPFPSILLFLVSSATILAALVFSTLWLYQAWRVVLQDDDELPAGLMVGLLFVPFFNFYWIFRAVPGLSRAIHGELRHLAPARASSAGWVPGLIACVVALIPYMQPVALCVFLAWMLIANNAVQRLVRLNERAFEDDQDAEDRDDRRN